MESSMQIVFRRFDTERRGVIPVEEIRFVMKNLPVKVSEEDILHLFYESHNEAPDISVNLSSMLLLVTK